MLGKVLIFREQPELVDHLSRCAEQSQCLCLLRLQSGAGRGGATEVSHWCHCHTDYFPPQDHHMKSVQVDLACEVTWMPCEAVG
jgi:hypothetical protein